MAIISVVLLIGVQCRVLSNEPKLIRKSNARKAIRIKEHGGSGGTMKSSPKNNIDGIISSISIDDDADNEIVNINDITPSDVVIASGKLRHCYNNDHLANLKYWAYTANLAPLYRRANKLKDKYFYAEQVLQFVHQDLKGRFLHWKDTGSDKLVVLSRVDAKKKIVERFKMSLRKRTVMTTSRVTVEATMTTRTKRSKQLRAVKVEAEAEAKKIEPTAIERALRLAESFESEISKRKQYANQGNESYNLHGNTFISSSKRDRKILSKKEEEGIQPPSTLTIDEKRERRKRRSDIRNKCRPLIVRVRRENKRRTLARFIKKKELKPKMDRLYFKNVCYRNVKPISDFIYNNCEFIIYSQSQWKEKQETLKMVCEPIIKACKNKQNQNYNKDIQWQKYDYNKEYLVGVAGFKLCTGNTLVCVKDRCQNYAIKYIYIPLEYNNCHREAICTSMTELANSVFEMREGKNVVTQSARLARGMTEISTRGGKKACSGRLIMTGSHNLIPNSAHKMEGITNSTPAMYNFNNRNHDKALIAKWISVSDSISQFEKKHIPAYAKRRRQLRKKHDPKGRFQISDKTEALAVSLTTDYTITGHDDNGLTSETIGFVNRNGALPTNHSWNFVAGGCVHTLPRIEGGASGLFIDADKVFHGTLPTSNIEVTCNHGNLGSALVTKKNLINSLKRQKRRLLVEDDCTKEYMTARCVFG